MSEHWPAFFLLFARLSGFFLLSPFFSTQALPKMIRLGVALAVSLLLAPPFFVKFQWQLNYDLLWLIDVLKELLIGYLVGFIFSLFVEAAAFTGQWIGTLMGFSATELLEPLSTTSHPLLSRFFTLIVFTLFFALDLHHPLLKLLFESYDTFPLKSPIFNQNTLLGALESAPLLFQKALQFALFPLLILLSLMAVFALLARFLPIFWIGFPLQLLVGFLAIGVSVGWLAPTIEKSFFQLLDIVKKFIVNY